MMEGEREEVNTGEGATERKGEERRRDVNAGQGGEERRRGEND